jgi:two-component system nitrogen regulation response regulator NtrX
MPKILLVDDEKRIRDSIRLTLSGGSYEIIEAEDPDEAYQKIQSEEVDLIFLDIHFSGTKTSLPLLEKLRNEGNIIPIVVLSGAASAKESADAIKLGAYDFLEKPVTSDRLILTLQNALRAFDSRARAERLPIIPSWSSNLIGSSAAMETTRDLISRYGSKDAKVLITGETGTGKEVIAHAIWLASERQKKPFIIVNSAAIPDSLIESELFGHRKGAFSGAISNQIGKIEMAHQGTLFLDEIGELSPHSQSKLLRFLETGEIQVLGSSRPKNCDVRLIAATSRDLPKEIKAGRFREDLFFRLNVARIEIAPLRDRKEDILPLFIHFIGTFCKRYGEAMPTVDIDAEKLLSKFAWPGNVRELRNVAERAILMCQRDITVELLRLVLGNGLPTEVTDLPASLGEVLPLRQYRQDSEARYIRHVIDLADGSVSKAALALGLDRSHLHQKLREFGSQ